MILTLDISFCIYRSYFCVKSEIVHKVSKAIIDMTTRFFHEIFLAIKICLKTYLIFLYSLLNFVYFYL